MRKTRDIKKYIGSLFINTIYSKKFYKKSSILILLMYYSALKCSLNLVSRPYRDTGQPSRVCCSPEAGADSATPSKNLMWLPLGDNITWGGGTDAKPRGGAACCPTCGGYRVPLAWSLLEAGYNASTMGTHRCARRPPFPSTM
jgi:hypothetical protein